MVAAGAGAVAGVAGTPLDASDATRSREPAAASPETRDPAPDGPDRLPDRALLVGHAGADGRLDLLLAAAVSGEGSRVDTVLVPTATLVEVPSLGARALAEVAALGGAELLETSVENAFGVGFEPLVLLDDAALIELLAAAVSFDVEFRRAIRVDDDAGTFGFRAGVHEVQAGEAVRLLLAPDAEGELEHLVVVQAVLEGWRGALRADTAAARAAAQAQPGLAPLVESVGLAARYETLPVERVSTGGDERFRLRRDDARHLLDEVFDFTLLGGGGPRPRVEVLNGTGAIGLTQAVAAVIVPAGVEITLTGNVPGFGIGETQVVYYRDDNAAAARHTAEALGVGRVLRAREPLGVVDLTIIVGSDFVPATPVPTAAAVPPDPATEPA